MSPTAALTSERVSVCLSAALQDFSIKNKLLILSERADSLGTAPALTALMKLGDRLLTLVYS